MSVTDLRTRLTDKLFEPRDIASLVFFRVGFGIILLWEVYRFFNHRWIEGFFIATRFNFTYEFFDWVKPWPGQGMYFHFYLLGFLSVLIALGLFYRVASVLFFLGFTYIFLLEQTLYLNHFYLLVLVSFLMIFLPAHRNYSVDAWLRKNIKTSSIPFWALFLIQFQISVVYVFGAVAKMSRDWIGGEPMRHWLANRARPASWRLTHSLDPSLRPALWMASIESIGRRARPGPSLGIPARRGGDLARPLAAFLPSQPPARTLRPARIIGPLDSIPAELGLGTGPQWASRFNPAQ